MTEPGPLIDNEHSWVVGAVYGTLRRLEEVNWRIHEILDADHNYTNTLVLTSASGEYRIQITKEPND